MKQHSRCSCCGRSIRSSYNRLDPEGKRPLCSFCWQIETHALAEQKNKINCAEKYVYCHGCGVKTRLKIARNHEDNHNLYCSNCYEQIQISKEKEIRKNLKEMVRLRKLEDKKNVES